MSVVDVVAFLGFMAFWLLLFVGTTSTMARVAYYRAHGFQRPRLLVRDVNMITGFAISFGLVLVARVARAAGYDTSGLGTNIVWLLLTTIPAVWAVAVYAYFEVFVIEKGKDNVRDRTYLDPPRPDAP